MEVARARYDVFLSHNRADKAWTRLLASALRGAGLSVFFDEDSIQLGEDVPRALEAAIRSSRHILLVLSREAVASHWVALEVSAAIHTDPASVRRFVIPVLRGDCEIPLLLSRLNYLDAREGSIEQHLPRLLAAIRSTDPSANQAHPPAEAITPPIKIARRFSPNLPPPPGHQRYRERYADRMARSAIEHGDMLIITGRKRIGKTSLLVQAASFAEQMGKKTILLDLQTYVGSNERDLFSSLAARVAEGINLASRRDLTRQGGRAAFVAALGRIPKDHVLMFDEFAALRAGQRSVLAGLLRAFMSERFLSDAVPVLISSFVHPAEFIPQDQSASDLSLCALATLENFSARETDELACAALPQELRGAASKLHELVGGDPYLVQLGIDHLLAGGSLDIETLAASDEYRKYFSFLAHSIEPELLAQLSRSGLASVERRHLEIFEQNGLVSRNSDGTLRWGGTLVEAVFTGRTPRQ